MTVDAGTLLRWGAVALPTALAIAGVWIAVEVPKVEKTSTKWALRIGFLVLGALTSVIVYSQQAYDRRESERTQDALNGKISSLEKSQSYGFQHVEKTIESVSAPNITVQPAPVVLGNTPAPVQHAKIEVDHFEIGHKAEQYFVNTYLRNIGQIAGDVPNRVFSVAISPEPLDPSKIKEMMDGDLALSIKQNAPPKDRSQLEPRPETSYVSDFISASPASVALIDGGKAWIYLFEVFVYRDRNTGKSYWVTEYCTAKQPDGAFNHCGTGNRTWLHR